MGQRTFRERRDEVAATGQARGVGPRVRRKFSLFKTLVAGHTIDPREMGPIERAAASDGRIWTPAHEERRRLSGWPVPTRSFYFLPEGGAGWGRCPDPKGIFSRSEHLSVREGLGGWI